MRLVVLCVMSAARFKVGKPTLSQTRRKRAELRRILMIVFSLFVSGDPDTTDNWFADDRDEFDRDPIFCRYYKCSGKSSADPDRCRKIEIFDNVFAIDPDRKNAF